METIEIFFSFLLFKKSAMSVLWRPMVARDSSPIANYTTAGDHMKNDHLKHVTGKHANIP